ncbi:MAG: hypothetical protein J7L94_03110 [Caldisericaceae bacterium]|nr:hypothetical protein [Caldisericaceae bacterium]
MRNLIKLLLISTFMIGLIACGGQKKAEVKEETVTTQTAPADTAAQADTTQADTTQVQE